MPARTRLAAKKEATKKAAANDEAAKDAAAAKAVPTAKPSAAPTRIPFKSIENNRFVSASKSTASTSTSKVDIVHTPLESVDATIHDLTKNNDPTITEVHLSDLKEGCMFQPSGINQELFEKSVEVGECSVHALSQDEKAKPVEEMMEFVEVRKEHQEAYSKRNQCLRIHTKPHEEHAKRDNSRIAVYLILKKDDDGNWVIVKVGTNNNGARSEDYVNSETQRYVEIVSFCEASDDAEEKLVKAFENFLKDLDSSAAPRDFCLFAKACKVGGMYYSLLRTCIMRAVESFLAKKFGIAHHLTYNPHEFIVGTEELVEETIESHEQTCTIMLEAIGKELEGLEAIFCGFANTWKTDDPCFSGGSQAISAQIMMSKYATDGVPVGQKENHFDLLERVPQNKDDPDSPYCTSYGSMERKVGIQKAWDWQHEVSNTEGGIATGLLNGVLFEEHERCKDLKEYLTKECGWEEKHIFRVRKAQISLLSKNKSVILVTNAPGLAFDPRINARIQEEILFVFSILHTVLRRQKWKEKIFEYNFDPEEGILVHLVSQRLKLLCIGGYYRSHFLKYFFLHGELRERLFSGEIDNLYRTTRVTSLRRDSYIRTSFNSTTLYHMPCADRNMRDFVQEKLNEDRVKLNINLSSLKNKTLYLDRIEPIIAVLCSLYKAKGKDRKELESLFKAMTAPFANAAQFKEGTWDNDEIIQFIGTLKELCPDLDADLSMIPKGKNLATGIPTRSSDQTKRFVRDRKKQLKKKNKSATIHDLVALLQNFVDFQLLDHYVILGGNGNYFKNGHVGNALFLTIVRSVIQGKRREQTLRDLVPAVLTKVEEAELGLFSYDAKNGIFYPLSEEKEKNEKVYNVMKK